MKSIILFAAMLYKEVKEDDLISISNDLSYKILLSMFPLILFLFSILAYLELDVTYLMNQMNATLPASLVNLIEVFVEEVLTIKRPSILSSSLFFAVFSASSGFNSVMKGINKAYGHKDERLFIIQRMISVLLVFVFTFTIIITMIMLIFGDKILAFIAAYFYTNMFILYLFGLAGNICSMIIMLFAVMIINRLSLGRYTSFKDLLPGSLVTVLVWVVASKGFNIYINNFSRYSSIYGSVAGIMILMIWLNIICTVLLLGSEINAILERHDL